MRFCAWRERRCNWMWAKCRCAKSNSNPCSRRPVGGAGAISDCAVPLALRTAKRLQFAFRLRQTLDDELVGVIDHLFDLPLGDHSVERDGVPMFLVHVVAGLDLLVAVA